MSNKTQFQANNTNLASLIQTLQGKAAGGVETCTITTSGEIEAFMSYSNGTELIIEDSEALYLAGTVTVAKNSLIYITSTNPFGFNVDGITIEGEATIINSNSSSYIVAITGDCTIALNL